jgi:glutamyl-tRNA synthetase
MPPLRLSIVGALKGPQLFEIMELIGQEESVSRMRFAVANIKAKP